jgi:hypothetical protein
MQMTCKHCGKIFTHIVELGTRTIRLSKRRAYCFKCLPLGVSYTTQFSREGSKCKCQQCGADYIYNNKRRCTLKYCRKCYCKQYWDKTFAYVKSQKRSGCCICGYKKYEGALCFHHLNLHTKKFDIARQHKRSMKEWQEELKKCILLCNRCHAEVHAGLHPKIGVGTK